MWQIPDAVDTVVCAPDDGWRYHLKHVEQFPDKINCVTLHLVGYILEYSYDARNPWTFKSAMVLYDHSVFETDVSTHSTVICLISIYLQFAKLTLISAQCCNLQRGHSSISSNWTCFPWQIHFTRSPVMATTQIPGINYHTVIEIGFQLINSMHA